MSQVLAFLKVHHFSLECTLLQESSIEDLLGDIKSVDFFLFTFCLAKSETINSLKIYHQATFVQNDFVTDFQSTSIGNSHLIEEHKEV